MTKRISNINIGRQSVTLNKVILRNKKLNNRTLGNTFLFFPQYYIQNHIMCCCHSSVVCSGCSISRVLAACLLCNQLQTLNTDVSGSASKTSDNWSPPLTACKSQPMSASPKTMGMWVFPLPDTRSYEPIVVPFIMLNLWELIFWVCDPCQPCVFIFVKPAFTAY